MPLRPGSAPESLEEEPSCWADTTSSALDPPSAQRPPPVRLHAGLQEQAAVSHRHLWQPALFTCVVLTDVPVLSSQAPPRGLPWSRDSINDSRQEAGQRGRREPLGPGPARW